MLCIDKRHSNSAGFELRWRCTPGCGSHALISEDYKTVSPVAIFLASDDEEVSPAVCHRVLGLAKDNGSPINIFDYVGATHDFDDPGKQRQSIEANKRARNDVLNRASNLFIN
jgi:dienelactone hydrolase